MLRWGIVVVAAAVVLGLATEARAQVPRGNGQVQFVPIDTSKNLATPIPTINAPQPKDSYFDRFYNALASVLPFPKRNRRPNLQAPLAPVMNGPVQSSVAQPQQPSTTIKAPNLLTAPILSGTAR